MASILKVDQLQSDSGTVNLASNLAFTGASTFVGNIANPTITGTLNLTGGQIKFPATQISSADGNTLDDYEEGTWTPTIASSGTQPTLSYSDRAGKYTKVRNVVTAVCSLRAIVSNAGSGFPIVQGLPFAEALFGPGPSMSIANLFTDNDVKAAYLAGTEVRFDQSAYGLNNNGYVNFSISYITS